MADRLDMEHEEGCLCGLELGKDELTADTELPEAFGCLEVIVTPVDEAADMDGCELDFLGHVTEDRDLPAAVGGVVL
ncbi:hypothetical protein J2T09_005523 [Neorhizobium huautlense]|uniref:Uncharacterized protein n=1 Tax=Neorhizobium huautlense TaxID=67774 RepID=A0ABT9Q1X3_9HYPH|nr:hypothetical protein [Neorhizobium huautlense]MDP9840735.1 hypothetical protein [Neorhizobium huautlense]